MPGFPRMMEYNFQVLILEYPPISCMNWDDLVLCPNSTFWGILYNNVDHKPALNHIYNRLSHIYPFFRFWYKKGIHLQHLSLERYNMALKLKVLLHIVLCSNKLTNQLPCLVCFHLWVCWHSTG